MASDFETPEGVTIYHKCLLLLHCCKYAIFDFSEQAGQLLEIERVQEYGVKTLAVWPENKESALTQMLKSSLENRGIEYKPYETFDEMTHIISEFLRRESLPSEEKADEDAFEVEKKTIQTATAVYYFDIHDGGHYFPVGDRPGLNSDMLAARGGGDINFDLLFGLYLIGKPDSSHRLGGSYIWHIDATGKIDTTYKGIFP